MLPREFRQYARAHERRFSGARRAVDEHEAMGASRSSTSSIILSWPKKIDHSLVSNGRRPG